MRQILPIVVTVVPLLFFMRLQRKRVRVQQEVIESLSVGADVMTTSGFYGRVVALDGDIATLELAPNVSVRIAKGALGRVIAPVAAVSELQQRDTTNADTSSDTPISRNTSLPSTEEQQ